MNTYIVFVNAYIGKMNTHIGVQASSGSQLASFVWTSQAGAMPNKNTFNSQSWSTVCGAHDLISPLLRPRFFRIERTGRRFLIKEWDYTVGHGVSSVTWKPLSGTEALQKLLDESLSLEWRSAAGPPKRVKGSPRFIETLLEAVNTESRGRYLFTFSGTPAGGRRLTKASVLAVRSEGAERLVNASETEAEHLGATLRTQLAIQALRLMDFDRAVQAGGVGEWNGTSRYKLTPLELLRRAADSLVRFLLREAGNNNGPYRSALLEIERISHSPYEGRPAEGFVCFLGDRRPEDLEFTKFDLPVRLSDTRAARGIVEMTSPFCFAYSRDGYRLHGLATASDAYSRLRESGSSDDIVVPVRPLTFVVRFGGHGRWAAMHKGNTLLRVQDGRPLGEAFCPSWEFKAWLEQRAAGQRFDSEALWRAVELAREAGHGALLIVSRDARSLAQEFGGQARLIGPTRLPAAVLAGILEVDGACVFDLRGKCHAIGMILDGDVLPPKGVDGLRELRGRGSRYNSTMRFLAKRPETGAIVVSSDGSIDLRPDLEKKATKKKATKKKATKKRATKKKATKKKATKKKAPAVETLVSDPSALA